MFMTYVDVFKIESSKCLGGRRFGFLRIGAVTEPGARPNDAAEEAPLALLIDFTSIIADFSSSA
jgi:hypothetical protein